MQNIWYIHEVLFIRLQAAMLLLDIPSPLSTVTVGQYLNSYLFAMSVTMLTSLLQWFRFLTEVYFQFYPFFLLIKQI